MSLRRSIAVRFAHACFVVLCAVWPIAVSNGAGGDEHDCPPEWSPAFPYDTALFPYRNRCLDTADGTVHFIDEIGRDRAYDSPRATILLLHGNPTWSFLYRDIIPPLLAQGYRVVAPDFLGFGLSSKPDPETYDYFPTAHAGMLEEFIATLDLRNVTLVVQDWSGPIGLAVAGRAPWRIHALVLMNTWVGSSDESSPGYRHVAIDWSRRNIDEEQHFLTTGTVPRGIANQLALLRDPTRGPLFESIRRAYAGPFLDPVTDDPLSEDAIVPTNAVARAILQDPTLQEEAAAATARFTYLPVGFIWGMDDRNFGALRCDEDATLPCPPSLSCVDVDGRLLCLDDDGSPSLPYLDGLVARWPGESILWRVARPTVGHFVQEHEPELVARIVHHVTRAAIRRRPKTPTSR